MVVPEPLRSGTRRRGGGDRAQLLVGGCGATAGVGVSCYGRRPGPGARAGAGGRCRSGEEEGGAAAQRRGWTLSPSTTIVYARLDYAQSCSRAEGGCVTERLKGKGRYVVFIF